MAIYHLSAKVISRGKGKSATAAAAYRAGEKIADKRTGLTFDYSQRKGVYATEIIAPDHAPDWVGTRSQLWNSVELFETRRNSRLAREFDIALPVELSHDDKRELVRNFVKEQLVSRSLVADLAFHDMNSHNPHVHIMLTTRRIEAKGFGAKERDLDKKDFLLKLRESWSEIANRALERAGHSEKIDHRTLEEQGINRIPQIHLGADVAAMLKQGIATERGEEYLRREAANQQIKALEGQIAAIEKTIEVEEEVSKKDPPKQTSQTNRESQIDPSNALTQEESYSEPYSDEREQRKITPGTGLTDLTEEFSRLTQRLRSSNRKGRKPRRETKPNNEPASRQRNQLAAKFEQLAERLRTNKTRDSELTELPRSGVESQTPEKSNRSVRFKDAQISSDRNPDRRSDIHLQRDSFDDGLYGDNGRSDLLDNVAPVSVKSTEPTRAHQRQNQQHRDSSKSDREAAKPVNTITSTGQPDTVQLTDAQLIRAFKAVRQWQDNSPTPPNLAVGKRLKKRVSEEALRKEQLTIELEVHRQILDENKPRSFLNPFGMPADLYTELQTKLEGISRELRRHELQLTNTSNDFQKWQKETRAYLAWREDPQTLKMRELASRLESSAIQKRLQFLGVGYAVYEAAQSILAHLGKTENKCRYFQGKSYRIEQLGLKLTITRKERSEPLYVATDSRETGGIIEISQFNLSDQDIERVIGCAEYLEEQQQKQLEQERQLGEELEP